MLKWVTKYTLAAIDIPGRTAQVKVLRNHWTCLEGFYDFSLLQGLLWHTSCC